MGLRRADMVISFALLGKARHHRIRSRLAGVRLVFKCRNLELNAFPMDGDPPSKVGYRRATGKYMLTSRFTADDPNLPSGTTAANGRDGGLLSFAGARANGEVAPKPAVPLSWVERVKPSTSTLIQTRVRVSPDCFPSSGPGRDRERGTAMIYAGRFIPYRDRWCSRPATKRRPSRSSSASLLQYRALPLRLELVRQAAWAVAVPTDPGALASRYARG